MRRPLTLVCRRRFVLAVAAILALGACGGSSTRATSSTTSDILHASGPVDVLYAASLEHVMTSTIGPAFHRATGARIEGVAAGSDDLASEIKAKTQVADVFLSASPSVNAKLEGSANGDWVSWYVSLGTSPLVLGYNAAGKYASRLKQEPWYKVIGLPGILVGRTDPATDPKGQLVVDAIHQAAREEHEPALTKLLKQTNTVFPEQTLVGRLQSGQLDAGFFYAVEAKASDIPTVSIDPVHLSGAYTVTVLNRAPHRHAAEAFVAYLYSPAGRRLLHDAGLSVANPPKLSGRSSAVPDALRTRLKV